MLAAMLHRPAPNIPLRWLASLVALALLPWPSVAQASTVAVHRWLTERALRQHVKLGELTPPTEDQLVAFYLWLGQTLASPSPTPEQDQGDPERFQKRFKNPRAFDAFGIRGFLGLSREPTPAVWGLEEFDREGAPDRLNLVVQGSAQPDLDQRNQRRFAYDDKRQLVLLPDGRKVPADPLILNMGDLEGLSSQAHAHYQLAADKPSADVAVLQSEPWNFVVAAGFEGPVVTSAAEMAQVHLDMAVLALAWADLNQNSGGEYLALMWASAGLHYVQDAAGPLHNTQVGSYEVFKKAKIMWFLEALRTGGGRFAPQPTFVRIGLDLLSNLHLLSERWLQDRLDDVRGHRPAPAELVAAWTGGDTDDPALLAELGDKLKPHLAGPFKAQPWHEGAAQLLVRAVAKLGSRDGAAMYEAMLRAAGPRATQLGLRLPDEKPMQPGDLGDPNRGDVAAGLAALDHLHAAAVRRALTATRLYWQAFVQGNGDAAARRLRRLCLDRMEAEDGRVAKYLKSPGPLASKTEVIAWVLPAEAGAGVLLVVVAALLWRRRRSRTAKAAA